MQIAVIGAGIIGVTTAYELARDGHQVTVFERRGSVAAETSFANAGVIAPGYVTPWAAPGMPSKVLRNLFNRYSPVHVNLRLDASTLGWMWRWLRACKLPVYQRNRQRMQQLALYSRERLHAITARYNLDYEHSNGYLVLLRSEEDRASAQPGLQILREAGIPFKEIGPKECRQIEPALNTHVRLAAGIYLPQDEVGNCRQFAHLLKEACLRMNVDFRFGVIVESIQAGGTPTLLLKNNPIATAFVPSGSAGTSRWPAVKDGEQESFDAVVICAGVDGGALLARAGLRLPLEPVYGYSVTAPLRGPGLGPRSAVMDERYKVAISRLGQRVRVAGSAELGGSLEKLNKAALETLYKVLNDWFPGAAHLSRAHLWKGARPMLPDGPPVLGTSGIQGVWLNLGHGSSGWALACGSARIVADEIVGKTPEIDSTGFSVERLRR